MRPIGRSSSSSPTSLRPALRLLISNQGTQHQRLIDYLQRLLEDAAAAGASSFDLEAADLAYVLVRIGESYLWREFITGDEPDAGKAATVAGAARLTANLSRSDRGRVGGCSNGRSEPGGRELGRRTHPWRWKVRPASGAFAELPVTWATRAERSEGATSPRSCSPRPTPRVPAWPSPTASPRPATTDIRSAPAPWSSSCRARAYHATIEVRGGAKGISEDEFVRLATEAKDGCPDLASAKGQRRAETGSSAGLGPYARRRGRVSRGRK